MNTNLKEFKYQCNLVSKFNYSLVLKYQVGTVTDLDLVYARER